VLYELKTLVFDSDYASQDGADAKNSDKAKARDKDRERRRR